MRVNVVERAGELGAVMDTIPAPTGRGRGYIPDPKKHGGKPVHELLGAVSATPKNASLKSFTGPIRDQQWTSMCVGFATARGICTTLAAQGRPIDEVSPPCVYTLARCIDREDTKLALEDVGSAPSAAMRGITEWGVVPWSVQPFDPATVNDEPDLGELEVASECHLVGYYRIDETGQARIERIRQALATGFAVCFAVQVDQAFEDNTGDVIGAPTGPLLGGHYLCAIGYVTTGEGRTIVEFANSWGTEWGVNGFGHGDEAFVEGWNDVYVMSVQRMTAGGGT